MPRPRHRRRAPTRSVTQRSSSALLSGEPVSIEHYGASAPAKILFEQFGFTADNVVAKANAALAKVGEITGHTTGT